MTLTQKKKSSSAGKVLLLAVIGLIIGGGIYTALVFFEKSAPLVELKGNTRFLGKAGSFTLSAQDDNSGLRSLKLLIRQNDAEHVLLEKTFPRRGYTGQIGPASVKEKIDFSYDTSGLENGDAEIIVKAADYSMRNVLSGNATEISYDITIDTIAPRIRLLHAERYIRNGGSGIVIYQIEGDALEHGAQFGGHLHPGHPVSDKQKNTYVSYIALPYDAAEIGESSVTARDEAGNTSQYPFSPVFQKEPKKTDRINVGDGFLQAKIPEFEQYYPGMEGSMKDKYLHANRELRKRNNNEIYNLCQDSASQRLWQGRFLRMAGASRAGYADYRTYYYNNEEIDRQVHLGMDIASTRRAEVKAANRGTVVHADYLGIYGNMVLLDHGQGVFSLYSHLSRIDVAVGDTIDQGVILGRTGKTGMAGGDHLHFSMLINGIFVAPKEWWDGQWIEVTIDAPLADIKF